METIFFFGTSYEFILLVGNGTNSLFAGREGASEDIYIARLEDIKISAAMMLRNTVRNLVRLFWIFEL